MDSQVFEKRSNLYIYMYIFIYVTVRFCLHRLHTAEFIVATADVHLL